MNKKKDVLPIVIATVIALVITVLVRFLLPGGTIVKQDNASQREISMPKIPLMVKETKKKEVQVLFVSTKIAKDQKIQESALSWKKWPEEALQPYFIAKTETGVALNNGADYSNALRMWAANDIPSGVPLTLQMLTNEDPVKKAEAERKKQEAKKAEEEAKKQRVQKEKAKSVIGKGMRAVTFTVNQQSAVSTSMLKIGDYIDVLIMQQKGGKTITHKYTALKILAIDGVTESKSDTAEEKKGFNLGAGLGAVSNLLSPRNLTLEVREDLVDDMIEQAGSNGIIVSLRNQEDKIVRPGEESLSTEDEQVRDALLQGINNMQRISSANAMRKTREEKEAEEQNLEALIANMNAIGARTSSPRRVSGKEEQPGNANPAGGKIEFVSGKTVGEEQEPSRKSVTIYRKMKSESITFNEDGTKKDVTGEAVGAKEKKNNK
ncbi:MAG: hypothetical protein K6C34_05335 [Alphaproteobacteria bacterium]|nr:hypothetical protein [Alphaproteobacteria bacterium]